MSPDIHPLHLFNSTQTSPFEPTTVSVTVGAGVGVGAGIAGAGLKVGVGGRMAAGVGVGVGEAAGVGVGKAAGVGGGKAVETSTATDRSLFMTTVACSPRLLSTAVQATWEPDADTTNVTMVPGW